MKDSKTRAAPRLQFTDEERQTVGLEKPIQRAEKAADKRDQMKARLRQEHGPKKTAAQQKSPNAPTLTSEPAAKAIQPRLIFDDEPGIPALKKPGHGIIGYTVSAELHRQVTKDEEDNTGLQAAHSVERTSETLLRAGQQVRQTKNLYSTLK